MSEPVMAGLLVVPRTHPGIRNSMFWAIWDRGPGVVLKGEDDNGIVIVRWRSLTGGRFQGGESAHLLIVVGDALEDAWRLP